MSIRPHWTLAAVAAIALSGCDDKQSSQPSGWEVVETRPIAPPVHPSGNSWPIGAAYIHGLPVLNDGGHSDITVDNRSNGSAVFVKLVVGSAHGHRSVRQFHIPKGGQFTLDDVSPGSYEIRYMDLSNGQAAKSTPFEIQERRTPNGFEYSSFTLTLYTVANGNMRMQPLSADEF